MPFDYDEYQKKCNTLTTEQLHKEWENYTRQIAGGATSTATSVLFSPITGGISLVGLGLSAPRIHNARKKREIIEAGLQARGSTHNTRKRDVIAPMAVAGTLGGLTLGLAGPGADMIAGAAVGHGVEYAVSHTALDATGAVLEHSHDEHSKKKAEEKLKIQYQNFQQQYVQEQGKLQNQQVQLGPQPGLQTIPPNLQNSQLGTPQLLAVNLPNALNNTTQKSQIGLQIPPPVPQHSRPGTPQPNHVPQYQPQNTTQLPKYDVVPVPMAYNNLYQPASHQQQLAQPQSGTQPQAIDVLPQYQPPEGGNLGPESYFPEKTPSYTASISHSGPSESSPSPSPLPQYTGLQSSSMAQNNPQELSAQSTTSSNVHPHPEHIDLPPAPTMEEEIMFLKARLIQLELEKREALPSKQTPSTSNVEIKESQPSLVLTPPSTTQAQEQINYPPPPASPALPPRSPIATAQQQLPPTQSQQYFPPPPPSPRPQSQIYLPAGASSFTYNPQTYPQHPSSPHGQQYQQPHYQRQDSGYGSSTSTPVASNRLSMSFVPGQTGYTVSPQSTGHHSHNPSISSLSQPSLMSPAPVPYFPPPPGMAAGSGKDYVAQGATPTTPNAAGNQNYQRQNQYGTQGWQWGMAAPVGVAGQPNYGPPPPIPTPWKG